MQLQVPQKRLGPRSFLACVLVIGIFMLLPIDLYVPALPVMQAELGVSASLLNLTMFAFFLSSAVAVVLAGPLSDRFGRRPLLVLASVLLLVSSAGCALSVNIWMLIVFRVGQACAYGLEMTVQTALIRDAYAGPDLKLAMTLVQSLVIIGPAVAPFLGSFLIVLFDWRGVFACLAVMGAVCTVLSCAISETYTAELHTQGPILKSLSGTFSQARVLLHDRTFVAFALVLGFAGVPYFAWIATVSYDLLDFFHMGYLGYSICYAVTSLMTVAAPYVYMALSKRFSVQWVVRFSLAMFSVTFVLLALVGTTGPLLFTLAFLPFTLGEGIVRPLSYVVMLQQPPERVGAASTVANFAYNVMTSIATVVSTMAWGNFIFGLTVIAGVSLAAMALLYAWGIHRAEFSYTDR